MSCWFGPPNRPGKAMPVLRFAMLAFGATQMARIELFILFRPSLATSASSQQCRIVIPDNNGLVVPLFG